jgi:hypothetical protein
MDNPPADRSLKAIVYADAGVKDVCCVARLRKIATRTPPATNTALTAAGASKPAGRRPSALRTPRRARARPVKAVFDAKIDFTPESDAIIITPV